MAKKGDLETYLDSTLQRPVFSGRRGRRRHGDKPNLADNSKNPKTSESADLVLNDQPSQVEAIMIGGYVFDVMEVLPPLTTSDEYVFTIKLVGDIRGTYAEPGATCQLFDKDSLHVYKSKDRLLKESRVVLEAFGIVPE